MYYLKKEVNEEVYFGMQINMEVFHKFILPFWIYVSRHAQSTQNKKFAYLRKISRKACGIKLIFCLHINTKVFCKLIVSLWVCIARHAQSIQDKFTMSLQYLKENVKDEVNFYFLKIIFKFLRSE